MMRDRAYRPARLWDDRAPGESPVHLLGNLMCMCVWFVCGPIFLISFTFDSGHFLSRGSHFPRVWSVSRSAVSSWHLPCLMHKRVHNDSPSLAEPLRSNITLTLRSEKVWVDCPRNVPIPVWMEWKEWSYQKCRLLIIRLSLLDDIFENKEAPFVLQVSQRRGE